MQKNLLLIIIAIVLVAGALFVASYFSKPKIDVSGIILFYGDGCPHCENVDKFISENNVEEKVEFTRLEVFNNKSNAELLAKKAIFCEVDISQGVPVPFLWDGKNCLVGDEDIIKFFQNKINSAGQ